MSEQDLIAAQAQTNTGLNALEGTGLHEHYRAALYDMAYEGLDTREAAKRQNIRLNNFHAAISRPHVKRAYKQLVAAIRDNAAQAAYLRINHMSKNADSEHVKLKANEWVAGVDGISKVQKVEGNMRHNVVFGGFDYPDLEAKDVTPRDNKSPASDDDDE